MGIARAASATVSVLVAGLVLGACSGGSGDASGSSSDSSPAPPAASSSSSASSVPVPAGYQLTEAGSRKAFGKAAAVLYRRGATSTVLQISVHGVRRGRLADFDGFILDDRYKRSGAYYYASVVVRNLGRSDVGGAEVPLQGVDAKRTLLPAVSFTTRFPPCPTRPLPRQFGHRATLHTCLVFLAPDRGRLTGVSYRPDQRLAPVTWVGTVTPPRRAR